MRRKVLVLCDREKEYAGLMGEFLKRKEDVPWDIHIYTDVEQVLMSEKEREIGLLVAAESVYKEDLQKLTPQKTVILNESGTLRWKELRNIDKYQRADNIFRELLEAYAEAGEEMFPKIASGLKTKFIGIYSPVRRCMQTTFALTLGQILAAEHKTLYLNFEHYAGLPELMPDFTMRDLADLMYYLNEKKEKFLLRMRSMVQKKGELDYIPPMKSGQNLLTVPKEDWQRLISAIDELCGYEYVVMDLTDSMQGLFDIMRNCAKIYTITKDDRIARSKLAQYEQMLAMYQYEDVLERTRKYCLPKIRRIPEEIEQYTKSDMADFIRMQINDEREDT